MFLPRETLSPAFTATPRQQLLIRCYKLLTGLLISSQAQLSHSGDLCRHVWLSWWDLGTDPRRWFACGVTVWFGMQDRGRVPMQIQCDTNHRSRRVAVRFFIWIGVYLNVGLFEHIYAESTCRGRNSEKVCDSPNDKTMMLTHTLFLSRSLLLLLFVSLL